jgi:hypothetical protein
MPFKINPTMQARLGVPTTIRETEPDHADVVRKLGIATKIKPDSPFDMAQHVRNYGVPVARKQG